MDVRFFTSMLIVCLCMSTSMMHAAEEAERTDAADAQLASEEVTLSAEESLKQEMERGRQRALQMRGPRDAHMAEVRKVNEQVKARKEAILSENETVAELKAEIAELDKVLEEKSLALAAIFETDEELLALQGKLEQAQETFRKSQNKLRMEIAQQNRERRQMKEQASETEAKAADEAEATGTTDAVEKE